MIKKILLAALVLGAIGGFVGYKMWTKPAKDVASAAVDISLSATDLEKNYADEEKGNATYLNKTIAIKGTVDTVTTENRLTTISLATATPDMPITCVLDTLSEQAKKDYKKGEEVTLKGLCNGKNMFGIEINRCVLVK